MTRNIYYIIYFDYETSKFVGVKKKIKNQINAFKQLGYEVILVFPQKDNIISLNDLSKTVVYKANKGITNYRTSIYKFLKSINTITESIFIFRFPGSFDYVLLKTFSLLITEHKVVLEMPTFPIIREMYSHLKILIKNYLLIKFLRYLFIIAYHSIFSLFLKNKIDLIITYTSDEIIYHVPTIIIDNGVNTEACMPINVEHDDDYIRFSIVANANIWHGIDRVIIGLNNYINNSNKINILLNIVGDSPYINEIKVLAARFGIERFVNFYGNLTGHDLEKIYENTDIAFSSLGMHRINLEVGSPLKTKEYMSYGIPFVYGYKEKNLPDNYPFALRVPANEDPIDFIDVINFYQRVKVIKNYKKTMHDFALENYDWKVQMKKVIDALNEI